jgi:hypothetical protein
VTSTGTSEGGVNGWSIRADQRQEYIFHMSGHRDFPVGSQQCVLHGRAPPPRGSGFGLFHAVTLTPPRLGAGRDRCRDPLKGFQEEGFIGLDNAALTRIARPKSPSQKTMPPQKGCVLVERKNAELPVGLTLKPLIKSWK